MIKPWPLVRTTTVGDFRIFKVLSEVRRNPRSGEPGDFFVMDCVNWVNVVALTPSQEIVLVEQYRHGSNTVELEIPAGMIDATDPTPTEAGVRELREETGYQGGPAQIIGQVYPNPAIMKNVCYTLLVQSCVLAHKPNFDPTEELETRLLPVADLPALISRGDIRNGLVIASL